MVFVFIQIPTLKQKQMFSNNKKMTNKNNIETTQLKKSDTERLNNINIYIDYIDNKKGFIHFKTGQNMVTQTQIRVLKNMGYNMVAITKTRRQFLILCEVQQ